MISEPPKLSPISGLIPKLWLDWFMYAYRLLSTIESTGTTAQRPTTNLYPGRFYFDQSLGLNGKPIWRNKGNTGWVDATGAAV